MIRNCYFPDCLSKNLIFVLHKILDVIKVYSQRIGISFGVEEFLIN